MEDKNAANKENAQKLQLAQINRALGVFMLFFGAIIIISLFFTDTFIGKMTNLTAGFVFGLIGAVFVIRSKKKP